MIGGALPHNKSLAILNLDGEKGSMLSFCLRNDGVCSDNDFGDQGMKVITDCLKSNKSLTSLSCDSNNNHQ